MGFLASVFLVVAFWSLIRGEAWFAGRWVRRMREPRLYWTSIWVCVGIAVVLFAIGPLR